jgi:hypothetical protein
VRSRARFPHSTLCGAGRFAAASVNKEISNVNGGG